MTASTSRPSTSEPVDVDPVRREEQARVLCLRLLTARARTRAELAGQLAKRGYPADISTRVLDRLVEVGLIDDVDFARQWVWSRRTRTGKSTRALTAELRNKGIDDEIIATVLDDTDAETDRDRAGKLVRNKLRRETLGEDDVRLVRRLVGMLARRGYSQSTAYDVVGVELAIERQRRLV